MRVIYEPKNIADGDRQWWDFDPDAVYADEAELIEDHWGKPWDHFVVHVRGGSVKAKRLLLWHLMRGDHARQYANLKDVPRFRTGEVFIEASPAELLEQKKVLDTPGVLTPEEHSQATAAFEIEYAAALEREGLPVEPAPETVPGPVPTAVPEIPLPSDSSVTFGGTTG